MIWLFLIVSVTYARTFFNSFISDDITVSALLAKEKYRIDKKLFLSCPVDAISRLFWRIFKNNVFLHHLFNFAIFSSLVLSFYVVGKKFIPEPVAFLAALIFAVHPCNAQVGAWISGRWYAVATLVALWAIYCNNLLFYFISALFSPNTLLVPLTMNLSLPIKGLSIFICLLFLYRMVESKSNQAMSEGVYKKDNLRFYPRKLIIASKSIAYYFTQALFPLRMGWFHTIGEPIDEKLKSMDFHFVLSVLLFMTFTLFLGTPAFLGLWLFLIFIAPFSNIITPGLFTSERYMTPALMGFSIFMAYNLINYPILAAVFITAYFMRTQLELLAYRDDFSLALYSLINFTKSGFAWSNLSNYFLQTRRPSAAFDTLQEAIKEIPEFPTTYYQLYLMYRAVDLLNDMDKALFYLEKACHYGYHENWYKELEDFRNKLRIVRVKKFKERYATRYPAIRQLGHGAQPSPQDSELTFVGAVA